MSQVVTMAARRAPARATARAFAPLSIDVRRDLSLTQAERADLESLILTRPYVGIFVSPAWLTGYFDEPAAGCERALVMLRQSGALRAVVPITTRQTPGHVRVSLVGGGFGSDRVDLLAARGWETACADLFLSWLSETYGAKGFVLELRDVPGSSPLWAAIHRVNASQSRPLVLMPREVNPVPYLDLRDRVSARAAGSAEIAPASLDRHRRWLERRGRIRIETLDDIDDIMPAFDTLVQFLRVRWNGHGGSVLDDPRAEGFHRRVLPLLAAEGRLRMIRLSADRRPLAVYYGLAAGAWSGYYLAGYDREWAGRIHLGRITLATAIHLAARDGAEEFDFLKGAEPTKYLWPVRERVSLDADVYSPRHGPHAVRAIRAGRDAAVSAAKSVTSLFHAR